MSKTNYERNVNIGLEFCQNEQQLYPGLQVDAWVLQWLVPEAALVEEFEEFQALPAGSSRLLPGAPENSNLAKN